MTNNPFPGLEGHDLDTHIRIYNRFKELFPKDKEEKHIKYTKNWVRDGLKRVYHKADPDEPIGVYKSPKQIWRNIR